MSAEDWSLIVLLILIAVAIAILQIGRQLRR